MIRKNFEGRAWRVGLMAGLLALLLPSFVSAQSVDDKYRQNKQRLSQFNIGSSPTAVLDANKFQCGLQSNGQICTDVFDSPTGGGGFWPTGTPDQYMFRSGVQIFGIIPPNLNFPWAGDTVGAFFNEGTGSRSHGTPLTEHYVSTIADDLANWPDKGAFAPNWPDATAYVTDTNLFNDVLIGRKDASQQDSWVMYWDGDPGPTNGRDHPMGITVEQRSLAWNYPDGNENIIYFIYKFTNVTNHPLFQRLNEEKFFGGQNVLPDEGWTFDEIYVASDSDPDVTADFSKNYATGVLPFNLGLSYEGTFFEPAFDYPPSEFYPPFFVNAPGFVGVKYLKSPIDPATGEEVGLTSFSLHTNGGPFPDPSSVQRGWRYVSLNVDAGKGDPDCTFSVAEIKARKSCFLNQQQSDVRFFIGSGPFSLGPGESVTIAKAMYAAAVVATPLIIRGASADNKPGFPSIHPGCFGDPIRPIDVAVGWVRTDVCPTDPAEAVNQNDVTVVPKSLLGRALVAQSIFDNKFLLGFSPEPPNSYLVAGDNQITVVWEPTATEQKGDPFFAAAGDPDNALFDPNYREFNVEGYRIYRGTSPGNLQLIAQFDKQGSLFTDNICITDPTYVTGDPCEDVDEVDLNGDFVQYPPGGVVRLADGSTLVINADTALASAIAAGNGRKLSNNGIPFAFVDKEVRNGFQYFYKVTSFDVNSFRSGPSSLESAGTAKPATPRRPATSLTAAQFSFGLFGRGDEPLTGSPMSIDPVTGQFAGKAPPTGLLKGDFVPFAPQLLPTGSYSVRVDSVIPFYYGGDFYLTVTGQPGPFMWEVHDNEGDETELPVISVPADPTIRQQLISQGVDAPPVAGSLTSSLAIDLWHFQSNDNDWSFEVPGFWAVDPPNTVDGGSRWYSGENESTPDPTVGKDHFGALDGITTIFKPMPYNGMASYKGISSNFMRRFYQTGWAVHRAADMRIYWSSAGVDSVIDLTHNLPIAFYGDMRATWGFVTDADEDGMITYGDFWHIPHLCTGGTPNIGSTACADPDLLVRTPVVTAVDATGNMQSDGSGFGIYIAGEPFIFVGPVPTSGTWTLRAYAGSVTRSGGRYAFAATGENPAVPGLQFKLQVEAPAQIVAAEADLSLVHTVPDPFYAVSQFDLSPASKELQFVNLPGKATIRIYSMSGVLVDVVNHDDPSGGGRVPWDLRNRSNQFVASGVYFYHVSTPDGKSRIGKFTVVNSGFAR